MVGPLGLAMTVGANHGTVPEAQQDLVAWLLQEDVDVDLRLKKRGFGKHGRHTVG